MLTALDALPAKRLIDSDLEAHGEVCALGSVGAKRGMDMSGIDPYDQETVAGAFGISGALAAEIMYENDDAGSYWRTETPEQRWERMRRWVEAHISK
jgi:hypothetical protein